MVHRLFPAGERQREAVVEIRVHEDVGNTVLLAGLLPVVQRVPQVDHVVVIALGPPVVSPQDLRASVLTEEDEPGPAQVALGPEHVHVVAHMLPLVLMRLHERVVGCVQLQARQETHARIIDQLRIRARIGPVVEHDHGVLRQQREQLPECLFEVGDIQYVTGHDRQTHGHAGFLIYGQADHDLWPVWPVVAGMPEPHDSSVRRSLEVHRGPVHEHPAEGHPIPLRQLSPPQMGDDMVHIPAQPLDRAVQGLGAGGPKSILRTDVLIVQYRVDPVNRDARHLQGVRDQGDRLL